MEQARYGWFLGEVARWASVDPSVIGLVALGSAANRSHAPDEWSDHDLWVVTLEGATAALRRDPSWLPDSERIVGWFAETKHGRSAVYDDGHLVEVAIFEDSELEIARANDFTVLYDAGGIETRLASISERTTAEGGNGVEHAVGRFVVEMIIGLGRLGRGELLSANELIRGRAVTSLLRSVSAWSSSDSEVLDNLDPHRRFELAYPGIAERIERSLGRPLIEVARSLVETADDVLPNELLRRSVVEVLDHRIKAVRATRADPTQGS
jgi:hypothetical protein